MERVWIRRRSHQVTRRFTTLGAASLLILCALLWAAQAVAQSKSDTGKKSTWHSIQFGIVKFNNEAPNSWNIYHGEKKGLLLVRLWKRYLFVDVAEEEVYDIDPENITVVGDTVQWSLGDVPDKPIDTPDFKEKNVGLVDRVQFRLGKDGHVLELQLPLDINGRTMY